MRRRRRPLLLSPGDPVFFPDPREADDEGLVAIGGDLSVPRLLHAYERGIFPWYDAGVPPLWWSPNPRAIIEPRNLHVSRSLRRRLRRGDFSLSFNRAFVDVMRACGDRAEGSWIVPDMLHAYTKLHEAGHAHSIEVWWGDELAGGLYGVQRGGLFAAESMFHRRTDASKIALVVVARALFTVGIEVFDVQFVTSHLSTLGATEVPRVEYLRRVTEAVPKAVDLGAIDLEQSYIYLCNNQ